MINLPKQGNIEGRYPSTELRLYSGVPWDNSYTHVRLYSNKDELLYNLEKYRVYTDTKLDNLTPIRVGDYEVRVPFYEMTALNINYIAFRNNGISDKWVFCFVTDVKWKSEKTTVLKFELDVFQNNFYNVKIKPCFVEYQHIYRKDDKIGGNLIPVNIETGDPVVIDEKFYKFDDWYVVMYLTDGRTKYTRTGQFYNHIYSGAQLIWWGGDTEDMTSARVNEIIKQYVEDGQVDAIVNIVQCPHLCLPSQSSDVMDIEIKSTFFEGYTPKNKKLYSFPWCYVLADNMEGAAEIFKFELSQIKNHAIRFYFDGVLATSPQIVTYTQSYKGIFRNFTDSLINTGFPVCSWNSDTFRAWIAQNKSSLALRGTMAVRDTVTGVGNFISGVVGAPFTGGASMMSAVAGSEKAKSGINDTLSLIAEITDKSRMPNTLHSKALTNDTFIGLGEMGVRFYTYTCKKQFAQIADSFFETYGYPINKITTPLLNSRKYWNYVKTQNCGFTGDVDLSQLSYLRKIFNDGVTLWHTDDIGNYSLEND